MSLPEIPDEAVSDAALALYAEWGGDDTSHEGYRTAAPFVLAAAWPHLYAAALRHAADRLADGIEFVQRHGLSTSAGPGVALRAVRIDLRNFADEATE